MPSIGVIQSFIKGSPISSFAIVHKGIILGHVSYKAVYSVDGYSVLRRSTVNKDIIKWTERMVLPIKFTGQIGFDFLETADGSIYPLECNPRATNGVSYFCTKPSIYAPLYLAAATMAHIGFTSDLVTNAFEVAIFAQDSMMSNLPIGSTIILKEGMPYLKELLQCTDDIFWLSDVKPIIAAVARMLLLLLLGLWTYISKGHRIGFTIKNSAVREVVVYPPSSSLYFRS